MRISNRTALATVAAVALLATAAATVVPRVPAFADSIDDSIAEMEAAAKDKDDGKCIAKMIELQDTLDDRVNKALTKLVRSHEEKIAAEAIRRLAQRKDESFAKTIAKKLDDKKLYKDERAVYLAYLDAAATYADRKNNDTLVDIVKKFLPTDSEYTTKAIRAYGTVREKDVVAQLIEWLAQTENTGQSQSGKNMSQETRENYGKAKNQVIATLEELTGQAIGDAKSWQDYWKENAKGFEFPDPNAPEVDPATLDAWNDSAYGYTIKKPEGPGWYFTKTEYEAVRMRLECADPETHEIMARADFLLHNLSTSDQKTVKALADWYVEQYKTERFSTMREDPNVEERKIGGHDFTVVTAKGESGGNFRSWGAAEMRAYLTQLGHICVRMEVTVRLGAEDDIKQALWSAIEDAEWKK